MVDNLNLMYGIANVDANTLAKKVKVDRFGATRFLSDHLY